MDKGYQLIVAEQLDSLLKAFKYADFLVVSLIRVGRDRNKCKEFANGPQMVNHACLHGRGLWQPAALTIIDFNP